jgi:hypothetical protein
MSFVGGSISQAQALSGQDSRLSAVEALAGSKVAQSVYDAKVVLVDAKDAEQDARLVAVEGRATALESDISGRVQTAIDEKVAQTVFDSLASELRSADSALTTALATKVSAVTQSAVDALQDGAIATKASIAQFNNLINAFNGELDRIDAKDAEQDGRLSQIESNVDNHENHLNGIDGTIANVILPNLSDLNGWRVTTEGRVGTVESRLNVQIDPHLSAHDGKLSAIEEFISVLLRTYTITKPNGAPYAYTGSAQGL